MARTIAEIKKEITERFMSNESLQAAYQFEAGADFDAVFSRVSIESVLCFVVAASIWTLEKLFDAHRAEITGIINELKPHTLRWYVSKAKAFMAGKALVADTDYYDTAGMTDEQMEAARVVKFAAAVESGAVVFLKIAGDAGGEPAPVSAAVEAGFREYMAQVKDAGVVVDVINEAADHFRLALDVWYNPMVLDDTGMNTATGATPVVDTIKAFIRNLPFNGEYRNVALVDALQQIEGVVIPDLKLAEESRSGTQWTAIEARSTPYSGYYKLYNDLDLNIHYYPLV